MSRSSTKADLDWCLFAVVAAALLVGRTAHSQPSTLLSDESVPSLYGEFHRVLHEGLESDTIDGEIYFQAPNRVYLRVHNPVDQIVIIDNADLVTKIYYPKTKRGFILNGKAPADMPIIPGITAAIQPDYGLESLGFGIYDQRVEGDSLVSYWSHSDKERVPGTFKIVQLGDAIHRVVYEVFDAGRMLKTTLAQHVILDGLHIPRLLETTETSPSSTTKEVIRLSSLKLHPDMPDHVRYFQFPEDARITEKSW